MLRFLELRSCATEFDTFLLEGIGFLLVTSEPLLVFLLSFLLGFGLGSCTAKKVSSADAPVGALRLLCILGGLLGLLDLLDVLDLARANVDLPAGVLLSFGAGFVVTIPGSGSLRSLLLLLGLLFLFLCPSLLLGLLLGQLLLLFAFLLEERGYPLVLCGLITHCMCMSRES